MLHSLLFPRSVQRSYSTSPRTDIYDDGINYLLQVDAVGFKKEDIHLSATQNTISLEAEKEVNTPEGYKPLSRNTKKRHIKRSFRFRDSIDTDGIQANVENGLLNITIPKSAARKIEVNIL